jgi:hypothetical protein
LSRNNDSYSVFVFKRRNRVRIKSGINKWEIKEERGRETATCRWESETCSTFSRTKKLLLKLGGRGLRRGYKEERVASLQHKFWMGNIISDTHLNEGVPLHLGPKCGKKVCQEKVRQKCVEFHNWTKNKCALILKKYPQSSSVEHGSSG